MWDTLVRPIREHLPLWLMLLPVLSAVLVGFARLAGAAAVRRTMLVNLLLSVALSVWLVALKISTGTSSPGSAMPVKLTTLLCRERPRRRAGSLREVPSTRTSSVRPT